MNKNTNKSTIKLTNDTMLLDKGLKKPEKLDFRKLLKTASVTLY